MRLKYMTQRMECLVFLEEFYLKNESKEETKDNKGHIIFYKKQNKPESKRCEHC